MKQYLKLLMVLLITAFAVSVGSSQPSTIKKYTAIAKVLNVQADHVFVMHPVNLFNQVDEGFLQNPAYFTGISYERSFAELPTSTIILDNRQRYYEATVLLKSTRQFAFNSLINVL